MNIEQKAVFRFIMFALCNPKLIFWDDVSAFIDGIDNIKIEEKNTLIKEYCHRYTAYPYLTKSFKNYFFRDKK